MLPPRRPFALSLVRLALALALATGCGSSFSEDEARGVCTRRQQAESACMDDAAFEACVACYEECGNDCAVLESCPLQFACE